jgi:hypothetical protein
MPEPPEKPDDGGETVSIVFVNVLTIPSQSCDSSEASSSGIESEATTKSVKDEPPPGDACSTQTERTGDEGCCVSGSGDDKASCREEKEVQVFRARFGAPYVIQMRRETSFVDFQKLLLKEMQQMVHPSVLFAEQKVIPIPT